MGIFLNESMRIFLNEDLRIFLTHNGDWGPYRRRTEAHSGTIRRGDGGHHRSRWDGWQLARDN